MNIYKALYDSKEKEIEAKTIYEAQLIAAQEWKVKPQHSYKIVVGLVKVDGEEYTHSTASL